MFDLHINNKTLLFGDANRQPSSIYDLTNALGSDFKREKMSISTYYKYEDDVYEYNFRVDEDDNKLESFILSISK